ncbi:MAG: glycoside hydrolase domain-containing protein, partial [Candidatus Margulisiibacteriota bacterium]
MFIGLGVCMGQTTNGENTNDILNGGFENWTAVNNVPVKWDVAGRFIPEKWGIEDRPDEKGEIGRMVNNPDGTDAAFGKYSLFLNGRLVSQYIYKGDLAKKHKFQVSLMAKGHGGNIIVRLREYQNSDNHTYVAHVMEILNARTGDAWRKYTAKAITPANQLVGVALEIIGQDVVLDNVQAELSKADFSPIIYSLPVTPDKGVMDGDFSEREWSCASGANMGFIKTDGNLVKRQAEYYLSSDNTNLLICLRTPFEGALNQKIGNRDGNVWEDDSYEIHINPSPGQKKPPVAYQFVVNALGTVYDARINNGLSAGTSKDWNCTGLKAVSKCQDNIWTLELAIPLAEIGLLPDKELGFNLCRNLTNPYESASLTGQGYFDYDKMMLLRINKNSPSVFWGSSGAMGEGHLNLFARIFNPSAQNTGCALSFDVNTEQVVKKEKRELTLPPGAQETVYLKTGKTSGEYGEIGLNVQSSADKTALVAHKMSFESAAMGVQATADNKIAFYPVQNKIGVILSNLQKQFGLRKAAKVEVTVARDDIQVAKTTTDKIEISANNINGQAFVAFTPPVEGTYRVSAMVFDANGNRMGYVADDVVVQKVPWLNNDCGKGTINRPFIPLSKSGRTISCWGRQYTFAGSGLPEQIISQDEKVLTAPVAFAWMDGEKVRYGKNGEFKITEFSDQSATFTGETVFENFKVITYGKLEYDGAIFYDIDIVSEGDVSSIPNLYFEMPFRNLKYFHAPAGLWMSSYPEEGEYVDRSVPVWTPEYTYIKGVRAYHSLYFPKGDGTIWTSRNMPDFKFWNRQLQGGFRPYLTFGNMRYGLC